MPPGMASRPAFAALRRGEQCCSGYLSRICRSLISDLRFLRRERASAPGPAVASRRAVALREGWLREGGFTLIELLVVMGIIAILMVLIAPTFTTIKSAGDVTGAASTITGVLDTARTYAKANNTYTWVGFAGSIGPNQQQYVTGQVKVAIVASKDGTNLWSANNSLPAASLIPVGKMMTLDNIHIGDTGTPTNDGTEFESRASVDSDHRISTSPNTPYPFTTQQTTFNKWIQFSPRGEALVHGGTFSIVQDTEVGVLPTHGTALGVTQSGNRWLGNVVAIQIKGFAGDVRIYRR